MKAASGFLSAASAVALSAALAMPSAFVLQLASVSVAQAATVSSIEVRGNQRVDAETIRNYLTIKPGQSFSSIDIDESVKRLFGTGLFSDVSVNQVGGTLVVQVSEYQVVNQVLFQGNKKIKDAQLTPHGADEAARHVLARPARGRRRGDPRRLCPHRPRRRYRNAPGRSISARTA